MLTFLIYTATFWFAGSCLTKLFYFAIQPGQILDKAFGWQSKLNALYTSKKAWQNNLGKALGDCQMCTSFWFMFLWYWCYFLFMHVFGLWKLGSIKNSNLMVLCNIVWYMLFQSIGALTSLFAIVKIKLTNKNRKYE